MAPQVGFEPTTLRLTAECSAIELLRSVVKRARRARLRHYHSIPPQGVKIVIPRALRAEIGAVLKNLTSTFDSLTGSGSLGFVRWVWVEVGV